MGNNGRSSFEHYREIVYALLRQYTDALDDPDDRAVATLARTELPRYVRYWTALLAEHEPKAGEYAQAAPDGGARSPYRAPHGNGRMPF